MNQSIDFTEKTKIEIEHRYQNMKSLLQEVRSIDKLAIISIGGMWGWIFSQKLTEFSYFHILPTFILLFYFGKTILLFQSYNDEKNKYKKLLNTEIGKAPKNKNKINNYMYGIFLFLNIFFTIYLYLKFN